MNLMRGENADLLRSNHNLVLCSVRLELLHHSNVNLQGFAIGFLKVLNRDDYNDKLSAINVLGF